MVEKLTSCQVCMKSALNKVILFQKKVSKTEYSDFLGLLFDPFEIPVQTFRKVSN